MYRDQFGEFVCGYWGLMVNILHARRLGSEKHVLIEHAH